MSQLVFDEQFNIIEEKKSIKYWKTKDDIPDNIKTFLYNNADKLKLWTPDNDKYYCSKCFSELVDNIKCPICNNEYNDERLEVLLIDESLDEKKYYKFKIPTYVFDVIDDEVLLYEISILIYYDNPYIGIHKTITFVIENVYHILRDKCIELISNTIIPYKEFEIIHNLERNECENREIEIIDLFADNSIESIIYTDNLNILRNTIYKYTSIWKIKDKINEVDTPLESLILYPIYYKSFEYLIKFNLYKLALNYSDKFTEGKSYNEIVGVPKKYLNYMQRINIDYIQLKCLRIYPTEDENLLEMMSYNYDLLCKIQKLKINVIDIYNYLKKQKLPLYRFVEYGDYIKFIEELGYDLNDRNNLYPKDFEKSHDELYLQFQEINNPEIDEGIKRISNILMINRFENENYCIFPATSTKEMIEEGLNQHNCLRMYINEYSTNKCHIYFLRKKDSINKSYVTIEVRENRIIQARAKFNKEPSKNIIKLLSKWEKSLVKIDTEQL